MYLFRHFSFTFNVVHPQKLKLHIELQLQKPKDKNLSFCLLCRDTLHFFISDLLPKLGEVAVITGGARGIGVEVVKKLLQCGMHVVIGMKHF
jgi:3-oxoacyl-ACP reductase-like protein